MRLPPRFPDLDALDLFVSVVECGSVSRAARAHGISQPSGSARLDRLERRLGLRLLRRTPTGSVPTDEGMEVAEWARGLLESAAGFHTAVDRLRSGADPHLRLAASYTIAEYVLPAWLSALASQLPPVELSVANSTVVGERVGAGAVDLGFVEGATIPPGLERRTVGRDELVVVVAPGHPWARRRTSLHVRDLAAARLVVRERGSGTREVLDRLLVEHAPVRPAPPLMELGSTTAVKAAVLDGSGPAVLSRLTVQAEIDAGHLVAVPVAELALSRTLRVIWRAGERLAVSAARLVRHTTGAPVHPPGAGAVQAAGSGRGPQGS